MSRGLTWMNTDQERAKLKEQEPHEGMRNKSVGFVFFLVGF
jgi:hypothetical protein